MKEGGAAGFLRGLLRGGLGLLILPLNSLLGTAASLSGSVRDRLLGPDMLPPRLRPPRHISSREPLSLYCWIEVSPEPGHNSARSIKCLQDLLNPKPSETLHMPGTYHRPSLHLADLCKCIGAGQPYQIKSSMMYVCAMSNSQHGAAHMSCMHVL